MNNYVVVNTKSELKLALENSTQQIIIINPDLASNIKTIETESICSVNSCSWWTWCCGY